MSDKHETFRGRRRVLGRFCTLYMVLWTCVTSIAILLYFKLLYFEGVLSPVEWFWIPLLLRWYLLREKESISSNIFRRFLQRLKSPKQCSKNSPDFGRGSRVAVGDKWRKGQHTLCSVYSRSVSNKNLLCSRRFWSSDLGSSWVSSQSGEIINVDFPQGLVWSYHFYFLLSTGLQICCVCWG